MGGRTDGRPKHVAVIKTRLLILQMITDLNVKKTTTTQNKRKNKKKRYYNKIVNTSIALEILCLKFTEKKKVHLFYLLTVWVTKELAIKVHKLINTVYLYNGKK